MGMNNLRRAVFSCLETSEQQRKAMFSTTRHMIVLRKKILAKIDGDAAEASQ